MEQIESSKV